MNGNVHSALQHYSTDASSLTTLCIPSPISLSSWFSSYLPTWVSLPHRHSHLTATYLTGLEACSPFKGPSPSLPSPVHSAALFTKLSYLPAVWGYLSIANLTLITPILKNPSRSPTARRIKSTIHNLLTVLRIQSHPQPKFRTNQIPSTSSHSALWLAVSMPLSTVSPLPGKSPSFPLFTLELLLILQMQHSYFLLWSPPPCSSS